MEIITISVGELQTNCYLVASSKTKEAMIIDPGDEADKIIDAIEGAKLVPAFIVNTHAHPDHLRGNIDISNRYKIPCYIGEPEMDLLKEWLHVFAYDSDIKPGDLKFDKLLNDDDVLKIGELKFEVLGTPGHSPGAISIYGHGTLFSGDTLFEGDVGRTDIPGGSDGQLAGSFRRLMELPDDTIVYPGHGPSTTIKREKKSNILSAELGL